MSNLDTLTKRYQELQGRLQKLVSSRTQLETQFQENKIVKEEFDTLPDDTTIYKLMGPVLLPQDESEAKINVDKRIEYIKREIGDIEAKLKSEQADMNKIRDTIVKERTAAMIPPAAKTAAK